VLGFAQMLQSELNLPGLFFPDVPFTVRKVKTQKSGLIRQWLPELPWMSADGKMMFYCAAVNEAI
jgi:hypothetical protein